MLCTVTLHANPSHTFDFLLPLTYLNVQLIHLDRFKHGRYGAKIATPVDFPLCLDLAVHMVVAPRDAAEALYDLFGVVVHAGRGLANGRYHAFVKSASGAWHKVKDTSVTLVGVERVLAAEAHILFYVRRPTAAALAARDEAEEEEEEEVVAEAEAEAEAEAAVEVVDDNDDDDDDDSDDDDSDDDESDDDEPMSDRGVADGSTDRAAAVAAAATAAAAERDTAAPSVEEEPGAAAAETQWRPPQVEMNSSAAADETRARRTRMLRSGLAKGDLILCTVITFRATPSHHN